MSSITDATIIHHVCIVLFFLWMLNSFQWCHPIAYFVSLIYLYVVHERYEMRLKRKVQFEERRQSNQRRVLSDYETVRWLNYAIEKIWLVCMEEIVSRRILLPIVPWFLQKYKPWTMKDAVIQHLYLGRSPPIFTDMRVLPCSNDDDHVVLELGMNFRTADDMSAILAAKLRRRSGLGMWAKLHLLGLHIEGKVLVGVKFLAGWPFIGRLRICFAEPPYFQMTAKPMFTHGLDVTEVPGIAGWVDNLLAVAFEQTLVEPNMLVVDLEKFASPQPENWFSINAKETVAHAIVEVLEAADMKPSDLNGLADPYVKGQLGIYRFQTKVQKKTLAPKWHEEFKIPIFTWESPNMLIIEVFDKDHLYDDKLGDCSVNINDLKDGKRHDMWLSLENIKMGRLHLALTVSESNGKVSEHTHDEKSNDNKINSVVSDAGHEGMPTSSDKSLKVEDKFEPINIEGKPETRIWIHHPGSEVVQVWEPRKGKSRHLESTSLQDGQVQSGDVDSLGSFKSVASNSSLSEINSPVETPEGIKSHSANPVRRGFRKISTVFKKSPRNDEKISCLEEYEHSPHGGHMRSVDSTEDIGTNLIVDDTVDRYSAEIVQEDAEKESRPESGPRSPSHGHVRDRAKSIFKHAGKSARGLRHTLSFKSSKKHKSATGVLYPKDEELLVDYDSPEEGSLQSSTDIPLAETGLISSVPVRSSPVLNSGNNFSKFKGSDGMAQTASPSSNNCHKS